MYDFFYWDNLLVPSSVAGQRFGTSLETNAVDMFIKIKFPVNTNTKLM